MARGMLVVGDLVAFDNDSRVGKVTSLTGGRVGISVEGGSTLWRTTQDLRSVFGAGPPKTHAEVGDWVRIEKTGGGHMEGQIVASDGGRFRIQIFGGTSLWRAFQALTLPSEDAPRTPVIAGSSVASTSPSASDPPQQSASGAGEYRRISQAHLSRNSSSYLQLYQHQSGQEPSSAARDEPAPAKESQGQRAPVHTAAGAGASSSTTAPAAPKETVSQALQSVAHEPSSSARAPPSSIPKSMAAAVAPMPAEPFVRTTPRRKFSFSRVRGTQPVDTSSVSAGGPTAAPSAGTAVGLAPQSQHVTSSRPPPRSSLPSAQRLPPAASLPAPSAGVQGRAGCAAQGAAAASDEEAQRLLPAASEAICTAASGADAPRDLAAAQAPPAAPHTAWHAGGAGATRARAKESGMDAHDQGKGIEALALLRHSATLLDAMALLGALCYLLMGVRIRWLVLPLATLEVGCRAAILGWSAFAADGWSHLDVVLLLLELVTSLRGIAALRGLRLAAVLRARRPHLPRSARLVLYILDGLADAWLSGGAVLLALLALLGWLVARILADSLGDTYPDEAGDLSAAGLTAVRLSAMDGASLDFLQRLHAEGHTSAALLGLAYATFTQLALAGAFIGIFGDAATRAKQLAAHDATVTERCADADGAADGPLAATLSASPSEASTESDAARRGQLALEARLARLEAQQAEMMHLLRQALPIKPSTSHDEGVA